VTLVADLLFVNSLLFLVTIEYLKSRTAKRLFDTLERVICIYGKVGFIVQTTLMDMEFEKLRDKLSNVILNTMAAQEHVEEIERKQGARRASRPTNYCPSS
jgi:hypothetical protein